MNPEFWKGRKVLVTGHTGFKGSWISAWLQRLGAEVTGFALAPPTDPSLFEVAGIGSGMASVLGDVREPAAIDRVVREAAPEVVIHMAAQALVRASYDEPVLTYATNVMGTVNLLEAVRRTGGVRAVVVVTSDKCYENREWVWGYRENEPMGGHDPYSNSKGCAELVTSAYRSSFFSPAAYASHGCAVASGRAGNVIGGGDWAADRLVPDIVRALTAGAPVSIRNPGAIRPWQHVLEPLAGYLELAQRLCEAGPDYAEGWNFGPAEDDARPVSWVAEKLVEAWGDNAKWRRNEGNHPHEAHYLKLDCSKARSRLDWRPRLPLGQALEWVAEFYKAHQAGEDCRSVVDEQIGRYEALLARPG